MNPMDKITINNLMIAYEQSGNFEEAGKWQKLLNSL